jgi:hypothetical protein
MAVGVVLSPTRNVQSNFVSAQMAVHVHTSPASSGAYN